jgi:hypothetical protein
MICDLESKLGTSPLYRIGRAPDPWAWPDWAYAGSDGTFGNRYDDPLGTYRVLYASSQRLGAFIETLTPYRPDPAILATTIAADALDGDFPTLAPGVIPTSWFPGRKMGVAHFSGVVADVGHTRSLEFLRQVLADRILHYGLADLDAATIRQSAPRRFTQEVSRRVYECVDAGGTRAFWGVYYRSRQGDQLENWALFEPAVLEDPAHSPLLPGDPDFDKALKLLNLTVAS